jgi:hypothetical protein
MKTVLGLALAIALAVLSPSVHALDDDDRSFDHALLDILLERGLIDESAYDELLSLAGARRQEARDVDLLHDQLQRLRHADVTTGGGKPGKLNFESDDGRWSMGIKGRIQVQATVVEGESGNRGADSRNVAVRRGRLALSGKAGGDNLTYKIEADMPTRQVVNTSTRKDFKLTDAWLNWELNDTTDLKAGQFKFPFGREVMSVSSGLNLVDGSLAAAAFVPDREPGAMLYGSTEDSILEWYVATANGQRSGFANQEGNLDSGATSMRTGARVVVNPMGKLGKGLSPFQTVETGDVKVSFGASYMNNPDQRTNSNGVLGPGDGTDARTENTTVGYDFQMFAGPFSFLAEMYDRTRDFDQGLPDGDDDGHTVQAGVFIVPNELEVVARVSEVDFETGFLPDLKETTLGVVYYVDKHNSKFSFDVSDIENKSTPNKDSKRARAQWQLIF